MKITNCVVIESEGSPTSNGLTLEFCLQSKQPVTGEIECAGSTSLHLGGTYKVVNFRQARGGKRFYVLEEIQ